MKKLFLISILSVFTFTVLIAQDKGGPTPEMFEKIKAEKISFFTEKLSLTPSEAQAFWPVYNEFERKDSTFNDRFMNLSACPTKNSPICRMLKLKK